MAPEARISELESALKNANNCSKQFQEQLNSLQENYDKLAREAATHRTIIQGMGLLSAACGGDGEGGAGAVVDVGNYPEHLPDDSVGLKTACVHMP